MKKITRILLSLTLAVLCCAGAGLTAFAAEAAPSLSIPVEIELLGTPPVSPEKFTVALEAKDAANPMPAGSVNGVYTMTITGAGIKSFPAITYTHAGIYEYTVYQIKGSSTRVIYDDTVYSVTVYVTNAEDGSGLEISAVLYPDDEDAKDPYALFVNVYPEIPVKPGKHDTEEPEIEEEPETVTEPEQTPDSPKTGDESNPTLYWILAGAGAAVLVLLIVTRKRTGKAED